MIISLPLSFLLSNSLHVPFPALFQIHGLFHFVYIINKTTRHINKEIEILNKVIKQLYLRNIYVTLHSIITGFIFFSSVYFSAADFNVGHKVNSINLKSEIIQCILRSKLNYKLSTKENLEIHK